MDGVRKRDGDVVVFLADVLNNVLTFVVITNLRNKSRIVHYEDKVTGILSFSGYIT